MTSEYGSSEYAIRKRPRGRPATNGKVRILPVRQEVDAVALARVFIELGLHFSEKHGKMKA